MKIVISQKTFAVIALDRSNNPDIVISSSSCLSIFSNTQASPTTTLYCPSPTAIMANIIVALEEIFVTLIVRMLEKRRSNNTSNYDGQK